MRPQRSHAGKVLPNRGDPHADSSRQSRTSNPDIVCSKRKAAIPKLLALCYGRKVDLREELLIKLRIYHYFLDNYFLGRNGGIP